MVLCANLCTCEQTFLCCRPVEELFENQDDQRFTTQQHTSQDAASSHGIHEIVCSFFRRSAFCRASLEPKTHTPVLVILAAKIHYHSIHRPRQTSCVTLVGHLNNAYISRKEIPTRFYILEKINNDWQQLTV